ncbi:hypothetical protein Nmel_015549 [Mimus melanotis]
MAWNRWIQCWRTGGESEQPPFICYCIELFTFVTSFPWESQCTGPLCSKCLPVVLCGRKLSLAHVIFMCEQSKGELEFFNLSCHTAPHISASGILRYFKPFQYLSQCLFKRPKPDLEIIHPSYFIFTE